MTAIQNKYLEKYNSYKPQDGNLPHWISQIYNDTTKGRTPYNLKKETGERLIDLFKSVVSSTDFDKEPSLRELAELIQSHLKKEEKLSVLSDTLNQKAQVLYTQFQERQYSLYPELKTAREVEFPSLSPFFIKDLLEIIVNNLEVEDFLRFTRSCKQVQQLKTNRQAEIFKTMVEKAIKAHRFTYLRSLFQKENQNTSDYPLELILEGAVFLKDLKWIFKFFTNIKKLHFVDFSIEEKPRDSDFQEVITLMKKRCSTIEDFAIINPRIWGKSPLLDMLRRSSLSSKFQIRLLMLARRCIALKRLNLSGCSDDYKYQLIYKLKKPSLELLDISGLELPLNINNEIARRVQQALTQQQLLDFNLADTNDIHLASQFPRLKELVLNQMKDPLVNALKDLSGLETLETFQAQGVVWDVCSIRNLFSHCPNLKKVDVSCSKKAISNKEAEEMKELTQQFSQCKIRY